MDHLLEKLAKNNANGKSSDLLFGFRCFTVDTITAFCFAKSVNAMDEPDFAAPIVEAMDNSLPTFHLLNNFPPFSTLIFTLPRWSGIKSEPEAAVLTNFEVVLDNSVKEVKANAES